MTIRSENPNRQRRRIWDTGPYLAMKKPEGPVLANGQDPASVEHQVELEEYERDYRRWFAARRQFEIERAEWEKTSSGGAVELDLWHVDAGEFLAHDPRRYHATRPAGRTAGPKSDACRKVL